MATSTRSSESDHLSNACGQVWTPKSRSGSSASGAGPSADEGALPERPHHDHRDAEILSEGEDPLLAFALERVPRHLNRFEPLRPQRPFELVEGSRSRSA